MNTPEDIIREMIRQRDTGGFIAILAWRLTETIPNISTAHRVMNAVYNNKSLEECLYLIESGQPLPEESLLNFVEET